MHACVCVYRHISYYIRTFFSFLFLIYVCVYVYMHLLLSLSILQQHYHAYLFDIAFFALKYIFTCRI